MSISGMEYQIDPEDDKKVQVQTVDNELVLIISQGDCEIFMEAEMYDELKKHLDEFALFKIVFKHVTSLHVVRVLLTVRQLLAMVTADRMMMMIAMVQAGQPLVVHWQREFRFVQNRLQTCHKPPRRLVGVLLTVRQLLAMVTADRMMMMIAMVQAGQPLVVHW